jgi:hypothetical protein
MRMAGRIGSRETGLKLSDASCTGPLGGCAVERVRQESGFGKAADRPPYDQKRTLEATNGTPQIDVKRDIADRDGWRVSISQFKENGAVKVRDAIAFRETSP